MWVAEAVLRVPISTKICNYSARHWNLAHPDQQPLELLPEAELWHMKLVGGQLRLANVM